jgi:hypothetical protein
VELERALDWKKKGRENNVAVPESAGCADSTEQIMPGRWLNSSWHCIFRRSYKSACTVFLDDVKMVVRFSKNGRLEV